MHSDAELEEEVLQVLQFAPTIPPEGPVPAGCFTVLDIRADMRRRLKEGEEAELPDTRQLNRVLTGLLKCGRVIKGAPVSNGRASQKPTWELSTGL